ncbi:putative hydrolase [Myxococcus stipitatus DSM 14675]|uniref:Putative hydrolase n=1 Tax=Myxococcus stipitatus (strain DSM 14675 / JCM 12634 / Mx s8) TaxID=1278073 RepID=L7U7A9_MYXSD|nr:MBL fold metallo-hydrolase [Myxococcus stipitatus]AGC43735.1 putative hydrolase [Myxococcus stipitatus DSM 14675]
MQPESSKPPAPATFKVHVVNSGCEGLFTNAFAVETARSVVAIDAMMRVSDARALRAKIDSIGKPLVALLITHGHPDHYNGGFEVTAGLDVPMVATRGVDQVIHRIDDAKEKQWKPVFGEDWPAKRRFPNRIVKEGETLTFDGVPFTVGEVGEGESHWDSYWVVGATSPVAFVGDILFNGVHSFMNDGHSALWLKNLDLLEKKLSACKTLYSGHGEAAATREGLETQRRYLHAYRDAVRKLAKGRPTLDDAAKAELVRLMKAHLATDYLEAFITAGANAVAAELAKAAEASP